MTRFFVATLAWSLSLCGAPLENASLQQYFEGKVQQVSAGALSSIQTREQWEKIKPQYRAELLEMFGLSPLPPRSELHPVITGTVEREGIVVEKLHFQSMPGLYVTANFYRPKTVTNALPTILYLSGHGEVKKNGVSYGNKVAYQHHGAWFARNGYACLILDTIQLGEIQGLHHGTYREGMWWWNSRGYTPAGVEAWNCMRALDYLETRPEVDKTRFGVTGRSGGGAYSWWITALDDRIKAAAPVAGITDLRNYVCDGVVEGHCDCMFFVNTYRWDYPLIAALAAPRPLLICNTDKDSIFPLDGVLRTHAEAKKFYGLYGASANLGLLITEGPHRDTQDLQVPVFRWFNRFLKGEDALIGMAATKLFTPEELKVFEKLPADERTSRIHETFVPQTRIEDSTELLRTLRVKTFGSWPAVTSVYPYKEVLRHSGGRELRTMQFDSESGMPLHLFFIPAANAREIRVHFVTEDELPSLEALLTAEFNVALEELFAASRTPEELPAAREELRNNPEAAFAFITVRGAGSADAKKAIQVRRRYMLLGETLDSMRVWDMGRGVDSLRALPGVSALPMHLSAEGGNAVNLLMYALTAERLPESLTLINLPQDEKDAPDYLNYSRFTSLPEMIRLLESGSLGRPVKILVRPAK